MRINPLLLFATAVLFMGCQLIAPYKGPITPTPDMWKTTYNAPDEGKPTIPPDWKGGTSGPASTPIEWNPDFAKPEEPPLYEPVQPPPRLEDIRRDLSNWWEIFQDPVLNQLEEQALDSSYTLWAALERVIEARAQARINFSPLLPGINFDPSFSRTGSLFQNPLTGLDTGNMGSTTPSSSYPSSSAAAAATGANSLSSLLSSFPRDFRFVQTQYLIPLNLNYEVDLWSQLKNTYYASLMDAQAVSQAYLSVLLSLTADVASAYFQLRGLDAQQDVVERNIRVRQEAVDLNTARYKAGLIVYLDVSRAQVELARAHSDANDVRRMRGLQENLLATLVGVPAPIFSVPFDPVIIPPPVIPTGLPSELLCRRPDIAEAERNLASAYLQVGVAYANFFPSLNLTAALGFESPFADQLFSWRSRYWQVGWNVMQTVFDAGRNEANLDLYQARFREAMANYQEQVLEAFKDVEDALVNLRGYAHQAQDLAIALQSARVTLELSQLRYYRGLINYLDVVDAERQLLEIEQTSVLVLGNRYVSTVMLIRALGGGWGPCDDCEDCCEDCEEEMVEEEDDQTQVLFLEAG
jgi:outer membrane protein, multidrug efflux system